MAKEFSAAFYKSQQWRKCRDAFAASKGWLCEECAKKGLIVPGEIVHHRVELTPQNITDPSVTLSWSNLELVCRECHAAIHDKREPRRYKVDEFGRVQTKF